MLNYISNKTVGDSQKNALLNGRLNNQSQQYLKTTLDYYDSNCKEFSSQTKNLDFHTIQDKFLSYLPQGDFILDFGCGSGRDSKYFLEHRFKVEASDGSKQMCKIASAHTGLNVKNELFTDLSETEKYNGIWACSSLLHLNKPDLTEVLKKIYKALKPGGFFYTSFKYGTFEGERNGRFFYDMTEVSFDAFLKQTNVPFTIIESFITSDARPDRKNEKWLNLILQKK